jgi:hypothetical protein
MERLPHKSNRDSQPEVSLTDARIHSCSLDDGKLDITLTTGLRMKFSPTHRGVKRYLYVAEYGPRGHAPDDFVERIERLLRDGYLGVPKLVDGEG